MKKFILPLFLLIGLLQSHAQIQQNLLLDYNKNDEQYADNYGFLEKAGRWALNKNYTNTSSLSLDYAAVYFDTLQFVDVNNSLTFVPRSKAALTMDSFAVTFAHTNYTSNIDSIWFTVFNRNASSISGSGINGTLITPKLWDTVIVVNSSISPNPGDFNTFVFNPGISLPQGQTFGVRVDFKGDTANKFELIGGYRDDCNGLCGAEPAIAGNNSAYYLNIMQQSNNFSGHYENGPGGIFLDCDGSGSLTAGACERYFLQTLWIRAYINANIDYGVRIVADSLNGCGGTTLNLHANAFGSAAPQFTYQWATTSGIITGSGEDVSLTLSASSGVVTVTVTDGNSQTTSASVNVTSRSIAISISNAPPVVLNCGSTLNLVTQVSGYQAGRTYTWNTGLTGNSSMASYLNVSSPGPYSVTVTNSSGCSATAAVNVTYANGLTNTVSYTAPTPICQNLAQTFTNTSLRKNGWNYQWTYGDGNLGFTQNGNNTYTSPGVYAVSLKQDSAGCSFFSATQNIVVQPASSSACQVITPSVTLGAAQSVCAGTTIILQPVVTGGTPPYTYGWGATGDALSCNPCYNPGAVITQNSTYTVTVTDANQRRSTASVTYTLSANCGTCTSGASACTPTGGPVGGGFEPPAQTPCATQGVPYSHAIQFTMYDAIDFQGWQNVDSVEFINITNLPCGLCWALNKANNRYSSNEDGCLTISGTANDAPGQYKFAITLKMWLNGQASALTVPANMVDQTGIRLFQRVKTAAGTCVTVDTSVSAANLTACASVPLTVSLGFSQGVCANTQAPLTATVTGGQSPYTYNWSSTGGAVLSCYTCANPTATIAQTGIVRVTVTDANNDTVSSFKGFYVAGDTFGIYPSGLINICQGSNVTLNSGGGITFLWSNSGTTQQITVTQSGTYSVTATEANGCIFTDSVTVAVNAPTISNYQIVANGPTAFCAGGNVTLNAGSGFTAYRWSTNASASSITVSQAGTYAVSATGTDGCVYTDNQEVTIDSVYSGQTICIVSLDSASGNNVVVWEKSGGLGIDSFRIYKEVSGQYQMIGQQPFASFSTYQDAQSDPTLQSYKYAITAISGICESAKSPAHETMFLTYAVVNGQMHLTWSPYVGASGSTVTIYRGSTPTNLSPIVQLSSGANTYTDTTAPALPVYYQVGVEIVNSAGCAPSKTDAITTILSNILAITTLGVNGTGYEQSSLYSFYDEGAGINILKWAPATLQVKSISVYDLSGRKVFSSNNLQGQQVTLPAELAVGAYIAELNAANSTVRKKIFVK